MPLEPELRSRVQAVRLELLDLHKLLLDRERAIYERTHDTISSPGEYLTLVLENEQFAWLRELSGLIAEMDEVIGTRTKLGDAEAEAALASARDLLKLREHGTDYQNRYYAAIQDSPDIVIAHCKAEQLLKPTPPEPGVYTPS